MTPLDPFSVARSVVAALDAGGIPYVIGGSVAASLLGEPRSTLDLDIMIDCDATAARDLAKLLSDFCYVDVENAVASAARGESFNAIHLETSMKIDFFFAEKKSFARDAIAHRRAVNIGGSRLYFYAAEDLIVRKLAWFRVGGEVSERQWRDVLGILRLNRDLDRERLSRSAEDAGVADLLERAVDEAAS